MKYKKGVSQRIGVVVIGRNEGDRLKTCIQSVLTHTGYSVYVDSGSTDNSVTLARELGATVVELDLSLPFTAARARNAGFAKLIETSPDLLYVQFVDGDCEVVEGWVNAAREFLDANTEVAVVCGRVRERFPAESVYNLLCDIEWDTPKGETRSCGGNAMMRVDAFQQVDGFKGDLIAGEEPELCVRFRKQGWKNWRLDHEMTLHDAAITRFSQWWKRSVRAGHAFAEGAYLHGGLPERHWVIESRRSWVWGLAVPLGILASGFLIDLWAMTLFAIYPLQVFRLARRGTRSKRVNWIHAVFLVLGKFPEMFGQIKFYFNFFLKKKSRLIEYK